LRLGLQHGVIHLDQPVGLPLEYSILPEELKKIGKFPLVYLIRQCDSAKELNNASLVVGYATHLVGKWHLGSYRWPYVPTRRGFDSFFGFWGGAEDHYNHSVDGFLDFRDGEEPARHWNGTYAMYTFTKVMLLLKFS